VSVATAPSPSTLVKTTQPHPTFFRALRGVWLFTWRSQLTWRRLCWSGVGLLALPLLIYLTTSSPRAWAQSHGLHMGNPTVYLHGLARRLNRAGAPLQPAEQTALATIITEEFARAENDWETHASTEPNAEALREQKELCQDRIYQRAQTILAGKQLTELQTFQRRQRGTQLAPANELAWGRTTPFYHCLIDLYFFIILPLHCVRTCGALIRDELEANTLSFLTTRPLSRARLLVTKFIAQTGWLQIWLALQTLLVFAVGRYRVIPELGHLLPIFFAAQLIAVVVWSALGLLFGQISKRYMALALLYGSIVEMGIGRIPTNINTLSMMRHLKALLGHDAALQQVFNWPVVDFSAAVSALVFAAALFLIVAALLFTFKEYHHTTEMQK
jgi:hypothetical protein